LLSLLRITGLSNYPKWAFRSLCIISVNGIGSNRKAISITFRAGGSG
jgi:hypothetical protein